MENRNRRRAAQDAVNAVAPERPQRVPLSAEDEERVRALMNEFGVSRRQALRRFRTGAVIQHDPRVLQRIAAIRGVDLHRARIINAERGYLRLADFGNFFIF